MLSGVVRSVVAIAVGLCAAGAYAPRAEALSSADACKLPPLPATIDDGSIAVTPQSLQPQKTWQRQGRPLDITVRSNRPLADHVVVVCFRWQVKVGTETSPQQLQQYQTYLPADSITSSIPGDKAAGALKITVDIPTTLPDPPLSPRTSNPVRIVGPYGQDNAFPLADVRVLLLPKAGDVQVFDHTAPIGIIGGDVYCDMPSMGTTANSGIGEIAARKKWQPSGGEFDFTVRASKQIPTNALIKVCYRWKLTSGDPRKYYDSGPTRLLDRQTDSIKVAAVVGRIPDAPWEEPADKTASANQNRNAIDARVGSFAIPLLDLVPLADARILILDSDGSPAADVRTTVGITNLFFAWVIVALTIVLAFLVLWGVARYRLPYLPRRKPVLSVITTRAGFASLSQFQIILWTFVVIASAAFVMALSGDLIEITTGTLVLLGISGTATVVAKAKSESDSKAAPDQPEPAAAAAAADTAEKEAKSLREKADRTIGDGKKEAEAAAEEAEAEAKAAKAKSIAAAAVALATQKRTAAKNASDADRKTAENEAATAEADAQTKLKDAAIAAEDAKRAKMRRHPRWSDLVMEETQGRELDVTRIQMLYFTLVTAAFVILTVITSYQIPVIPEGFLILMGISNSVYVGSKFAGAPAGK